MRLSTHSPSHPQPSTSPLSPYANSRKLQSTSATLSPPPRKRQRREPSPCDDIADTGGALNSHPLTPSRWGRPGRRGRRNPETKARKLKKYIDSGGPSQKTACGFRNLFKGNTLMLVIQKTSLPLPPLQTRFLTFPHRSTFCRPTCITPHTSYCIVFRSFPPECRSNCWQPGTALRL